MEESTIKNKRIARNTIILYLRTFLTMILSLYTSRITLKALGVDDYGIYNVVGGVISMFGIISGPLYSSISRFLTYSLGKGDLKEQRKVFATSINVLFIIGLGLSLVGEVIGVWFLNNKLNIPDTSIVAANWVLQFSILSMALGFINVPYWSSIVAHEKMSVYAYMSILDALLKLGLSFLLLYISNHVLIIYSLGILFVFLLDRIVYGLYCSKKFPECKYSFVLDKRLFKQMTSFATWTFWGNGVYVLNTQGISVLMNIFWGVVINAARGIASQIETAVITFVNSFISAFSPQIIKSYAENDKQYMFTLMSKGSKYSFFLILLLLIPIEFETFFVLKVWLGIVPEHTVEFVRLSLINTTLILLGNPYLQGINAYGQIRNYQIATSIVALSIFPITWISYKLGYSVLTFYYISILVYFIIIWLRMWFVEKLLGYRISSFIKDVFIPILNTTLMALIIPFIIVWNMNDGVGRFIIISLTSFIWTLISITFLGLNSGERQYLITSLNRLRIKYF